MKVSNGNRCYNLVMVNQSSMFIDEKSLIYANLNSVSNIRRGLNEYGLLKPTNPYLIFFNLKPHNVDLFQKCAPTFVFITFTHIQHGYVKVI